MESRVRTDGLDARESVRLVASALGRITEAIDGLILLERAARSIVARIARQRVDHWRGVAQKLRGDRGGRAAPASDPTAGPVHGAEGRHEWVDLNDVGQVGDPVLPRRPPSEGLATLGESRKRRVIRDDGHDLVVVMVARYIPMCAGVRVRLEWGV